MSGGKLGGTEVAELESGATRSTTAGEREPPHKGDSSVGVRLLLVLFAYLYLHEMYFLTTIY
jgi:hypothetical protein